MYRHTLQEMFVSIIFLLLTSSVGVQGSLFQLLTNRTQCLYHELLDTKLHFWHKKHQDLYQNQGVNYITETWRKTLFNGSVNNKKTIRPNELTRS